MRISVAEYRKRLQSFSMFTMILISGANGLGIEVIKKAEDITTDKDITEEQIADKLIELINAYSTPKYTYYGEALEIVCNAIENGYFYDLYEILDVGATLVLVDEDKSFCGHKEIIDFLANERFNYLGADSEGLICDVLRVVEGERYGVGEKCILMRYPTKNNRKPYIVKVYVDQGKIHTFEMFKMVYPCNLVADDE